MWFLYAIQDGQDTTRTLLRPDRKYTLGRKGADIIAPIYDKTISRQHVILEIKHNSTENWNDLDEKPDVLLKDLDSKFGTYINSVRLEGASLDQGVHMNDGDTLRIGTKTGIFRFYWLPLIICRQSMPPAEKQKLLNDARSIGAKVTHLIRSPYTHLLVSRIQITFKVTRCMAEGKPIISNNWLNALVELPDINHTFPSVADYLPPIDSSCDGPFGVPDFTPNQTRARLFTGKRFVFFDQKQYEQLSPVVEACNGKSILLDVDKTDPFEERLGDLNTITIETDTVRGTHAWKNIINALDSFQTRAVVDNELCWAILYNSIDVHCNTKFDASTHRGEPGNVSPGNSASTSSGIHEPNNNNLLPPSSSPPLSPSSSAIHVSSNVESLPPPSNALSGSSVNRNGLTQNHQPLDQTEPILEKDLDLDDLFDQIVGDEPSRPPPPPIQRATTEASTSQPPQITVNQDTSDQSNILLCKESSGEEQPTDGLRCVTEKVINKDTGIVDDPDPLANNDGMDSATGRKSKKARTAKNSKNNAASLAPRRSFMLPELENEITDVTADMCYTKVVYRTLVIAPSPPENWATRQRQQQTSGGINYKNFKKVTHLPSADPFLAAGVLDGATTDIEEHEPLPEMDEDDFSDIKIRPNAKRGSMWDQT